MAVLYIFIFGVVFGVVLTLIVCIVIYAFPAGSQQKKERQLETSFLKKHSSKQKKIKVETIGNRETTPAKSGTRSRPLAKEKSMQCLPDGLALARSIISSRKK